MASTTNTGARELDAALSPEGGLSDAEIIGAELLAENGARRPALRETHLEVDAAAGLARVRLRQVFTNESDEPLHVTYRFPLPHEAAVGEYEFSIDGKRIVGEIDRRATARERFDEAVLEGRSAAILEQERTTVFSQEIGNIPPHARVECEIVLDQRLRWLVDGQWEWRFPTVIGPRYIGDVRRVPDHRRLNVPTRASSAQRCQHRIHLQIAIRDEITRTSLTSPTHPIIARRMRNCVTLGREVSFNSDQGVALDRDIVVQWSAAGPQVNLQVDVARPKMLSKYPNDDTVSHAEESDSAFGLVTLVPPIAGEAAPTIARDLVLLIDTSGSMSGLPLTRAKEVASGLIRSLTANDRLEMLEFSHRARRWQPTPERVTSATRDDALRWIRSLRAGGGTEMQHAVVEALRPLRPDAKRQVVLVSDGYIGFETSVIDEVQKRLPRGCTLHSVGIGSAANRSLTAAVAQAGRGEEHLIGIDDDTGESTERILKRLSAPIVMDVTIGGSAVLDTARVAIPDLLANAPVQIPVWLCPEGGDVVVRGRNASGEWHLSTNIAPIVLGSGSSTIARLYARDRVAELDLKLEDSDGQRDEQITQIGLAFGILTRFTSWIAISDHVTVDPSDPIRREMVEQEVPHGFPPVARPMPAPAILMRPAEACVPAEADVLFRPAAVRRRESSVTSGEDDQGGREDMPLVAELIALSSDRVTLELIVTAPMMWNPDTVAVASRASNEPLIIDRSSTTRPTEVDAGTRIRLVLQYTAPESELRWSLAHGTIRVSSVEPGTSRASNIVLTIEDPRGLLNLSS
ncbi:MAG: VIT domain-containing protein [Planctomycetota bacterium]